MARTLLVTSCAALLSISVSFASAPASAQIHWDASAQVGVQKRVLSNEPPGGPNAGVGPQAMLNAHVALLPLVRVGAYLGHDIAPMGGELSARDITWGGIRAKILSPFARGAVRTYLFAGLGYEGTYARSSTTSSPSGTVTQDGASGGFFEVPFGLGASYTFWKPYALVVELGMDVGFGFTGSAYNAPGPTVRGAGDSGAALPPGNALPSGDDRFAIGLTVGIMLDL